MKRMEEMRCQYWLPKKKRFCANTPLHPSLYCGNHTTRSDVKWLPCPIDPSHTVLEQNLQAHVNKCPMLKQAHALSLEPYYLKGINSGTNDILTSSEMKRNLVYSLTLPQFSALLSKIRAIHCCVCNDIPFSYKLPHTLDVWIKSLIDRKLPYQEKHVLQQASILGNLEDLDVFGSSAQVLAKEQLNENDISTVVEFGAGRGYLTQILADCYGISRVFLVERKSYKLKADRSLRQKEDLTVERLRIDIEDLNLNAVQSLRGMPYLAVGKHLCGPATDLTLRCCLNKNHDQDNGIEQSVCQNLRGIAVATCCHHLCQWNHYTNRRYLMELGITKEEFHAMTWFTSWAVDADHGSNLTDDGFLQSHVPSGGSDEPRGDAKGVEDVLRNMKPSDRAALGFMCKDIIDMGRLLWVKECGLEESKLIKYVPSDISPENRLIVAKAT
ncbi:hypothetical protein RND81_05G018400 [Saponaria officinalis]|uniref:tRNA:m(4)X modification enzyme TRM13 n=1 Tax=Saponaria officinalis TaxID=3572 RepID=A0AAW1KTX9_SAPOF